MKQKELNIFADIQAKQRLEEGKKRHTTIQPNGSFSPTGVKLASTRDIIEEELRMIRSGEAPHCTNSLKGKLYEHIGKTVSPGKASIIMGNATRRIRNAFCYTRKIPREKWSICGTMNNFGDLTTKEYCELLEAAIKLPKEECADILTS